VSASPPRKLAGDVGADIAVQRAIASVSIGFTTPAEPFCDGARRSDARPVGTA
jgi:hypothetical protein